MNNGHTLAQNKPTRYHEQLGLTNEDRATKRLVIILDLDPLNPLNDFSYVLINRPLIDIIITKF